MAKKRRSRRRPNPRQATPLRPATESAPAQLLSGPSLPQGFWSYVHLDDTAEQGRIAQLGRDVVSQYRLMSGQEIELFLDRDSLKWGEEWRRAIDASLESVTFFVPVLTPRYFQRAECRRELNAFARRASSLGIGQLVLPILYVPLESLGEANDELVTLASNYQWVDWTDLRFEPRDAATYRRGVAQLAQRLIEANLTAERTRETRGQPPASADDADHDEPGVLDLLAGMESAMPQIAEIVNSLAEVLEEVSQATNSWNERTASDEWLATASLTDRLKALEDIAALLEDPCYRAYDLGTTFSRVLNTVDLGVRTLIEQASMADELSPVELQDVCEFFDSLHQLSSASRESTESMRELTDIIAPAEGMSRRLRPVLKKLRQGVTFLVEGQSVFDEWESLIHAAGIECVALPG